MRSAINRRAKKALALIYSDMYSSVLLREHTCFNKVASAQEAERLDGKHLIFIWGAKSYEKRLSFEYWIDLRRIQEIVSEHPAGVGQHRALTQRDIREISQRIASRLASALVRQAHALYRNEKKRLSSATLVAGVSELRG